MDASAEWDGSGPFLGPPNLQWQPATIVVDDAPTSFEVCDVGEGWVGVAQVVEPEVVLSVHSQGVALESVRLARLADASYLPPPPPDLGEHTGDVIRSLDVRFESVPFERVHSYADYWALQGIEGEHAQKLVARFHLTATQGEELARYWRERIDVQLAGTLDCWREEHMTRMRTARRAGTGFLFQLWFNTLGHGARTWLGNRYASIRPYTFRLRWRP
ncbi:MAG: hypothetical protein ACRDZ8_07635 [Acidimicrobiales bacterium]